MRFYGFDPKSLSAKPLKAESFHTGLWEFTYIEEASLGLMNVLEFYKKNVSTVYYSNGFSILFSMWEKSIFGLYFNVF